MIVELGSLVVASALTNITEFADAFRLPIPLPVTTNHVANIRGAQTNYLDIILTNGSLFRFKDGAVDSYEAWTDSPHGAVAPAERKALPAVIDSIRRGFAKLGYAPSALYLDLPPKVEVHGGLIELIWEKPNDEVVPSVEVRLWGGADRIYTLNIFNWRWGKRNAIKRLPPLVWAAGKAAPPIQMQLAADMIREFGQKLELANLVSITLTNITEWHSNIGTNALTNGVVHGLVLTDGGGSFLFRENAIRAYGAADTFFGSEVDLDRFLGKPTLSTREAVAKVRHYVEALGVKPAGAWWRKDPELERPTTRGKTTVPRLWVEWENAPNDFILDYIAAEIDTSDGRIRTLWLESPHRAQNP